MSFETLVNKTIQTGNGSNKDFDFAFRIPEESSLSLTKRDGDGVETAITSNYTVTGLGSSAGGSVNYPSSGTALSSSEKIIIKRVNPLTQGKNFRNQGDYSLEDIEDGLDYITEICQQLQEEVARCLKLQLTSSSTYVSVDDFVANRMLIVSADGQSIEMSSAEYGSIDAYLSTLVAIADDISAVAAIEADVTTVAGISANVTTVAGISANVPTVAGISANVTTVAGIDTEVTALAALTAEIAAVYANLTDIQNAASFGFPTLSGGEAGQHLKVNAGEDGYDLVDGDNLNALAGLTGSADKLAYFTGAGIMDLMTRFSNNNLLINGDFRIGQRGTSFTSATTPANSDDTYLFDRWNQVSDGNDIADYSQETTIKPDGCYSALKIDQETGNKQWGIVQVLEARDAQALINGTASLSFKARKGASNVTVEKLRAAIISWKSTADSVTSDVVGTWAGAGTNPTLATNWEYENTPSDLTLTDGFQEFKIENVSIDATSAANVAVFIWLDDTDGTVGDLVYISAVKLEKNEKATPFKPRPFVEEEGLAQRFFERIGGVGTNDPIGIAFSASATVAYTIWNFKRKKRVIPSLSFSGTNLFRVNTAGANNTTTNIAAGALSVNQCSILATVASGLGYNQASVIDTASSSGYIDANSEL